MKHSKELNSKKAKKHIKPAYIIIPVVLIWTAVLILALNNYVFLGGRLVSKKTESIDLTGKNVMLSSLMRFKSPKEMILLDTGVSVDDYNKLRETYPDCHIRWSVPLSSGGFDNESEEIRISSIKEEDLDLVALFPNLKKINADGIPEWLLLAKLEKRYPTIDIDWGVEIGEKYYSSDTSELKLEGNADPSELMEKLRAFTGLKKFSTESASFSIDDQLTLVREYPYLDFEWTVDIAGDTVSNKTASLDFSGKNDVDLNELIKCEPLFSELKTIDFSGCKYSNDELKKVADTFPDADVLWRFSIYGQEVSSLDEEIDFSGKQIADTSEIENALPYLKNLKKVIMSDCGISNEEMDALNKRHEDVKFVWTVYFAQYYLRTDETVFIAAFFHGRADNPRDLTDDNIGPLKYCTDLVALDIGHNYVSNIEFCAEMKDLKWLIIAMNRVSDISPLANCKELFYLELFLCPVRDISPLLECKKLRHLNICQCNTEETLDVLAQMTWLERCWMSGGGTFNDRTDREYVYSDEFLPHTMKRLRGLDHTGDGWRNYPTYFEMRDAFNAPYYPTFWSSNEWRDNPNVVVPVGFIEEHGLDEDG